MVSEVKVAATTVALMLSLLMPRVAETTEEPGATARSSPRLPAAVETEATSAADDDQLASSLTSWTEPSEKMPVARSGCRLPVGRRVPPGEIVRLVKVASEMRRRVLADSGPR